MDSPIQRVARWPRRALSWLLRAKLAFFALGVVAIASTIPILWLQSPDAVRYVGLGMQLLGLAAAAVGIRDTRRMFGKPSFLELARSWFRSIPGIKPRFANVELSSTANATASCKAHLWRGAGENAGIEARLAAAEANLKEIYARLNRVESENESAIRNLLQKLREESDLRMEQDRQLHLKIEAASTDGLHLAAVGVVWLACGVILSTIPEELVRLAE